MRWILSILFMLIIQTVHAEPLSSIIKDEKVEAQLISDSSSIVPNSTLQVAVKLNHDPEWHTYWENPGDSGTATTIQWTLPDGFKAGPIQWPYPHQIAQSPLMSYGYPNETYLLTTIHTPEQINEDQLTIKASVHWLMCKVECIPGKATLELTLPRANQQLPSPFWQESFTQDQPIHSSLSQWKITAQLTPKNIILNIIHHNQKPYKLSEIYFFPSRSDLIAHADIQTISAIDNGYRITIHRSPISPSITTLNGILYAKEGWNGLNTSRALSVSAPIDQSEKTKPTSPINSINTFTALFFAFIGGLLLNLMPCVLPVLSLKILGFIKQSGENPQLLRQHGLIFTLGVLTSFWVLAGILLFLRSIGEQIGWGFQFQSPAFIIFLSLVFLIFALNLFGFFEIILPFTINHPRHQSSTVSVFLNGVLATITATPCSAPFMGTALGFAISQSPLISFGIFTSLGLGMSLPYLLLSFFPSLLKRLPKPGPWMIQFKKFLGLLLLLTVVWLWWILAGQLGFIDRVIPKSALQKSSGIIWQPYSDELIEKLRQDKRTIFIDFTATWCLTCQVNKKIALEHPKVIEMFKNQHIALVRADWTNADAQITQALARFGKNSIPLYVLYSSDSDKPVVILPEILTVPIVQQALENINQ